MAFRKKTIVAVDDSVLVLKMLRNMLEGRFDLYLFPTGRQALQFLRSDHQMPDLIILDIEMPDVDGYEVLEQIKEMKHLQNVPVIFLTSNNDKNHVIKAVAGGARDYVIKPIDQDVLMKKIYSLLS